MKHSLLNDNLVNLTELIRSLQRSEGNQDCFRRHQGYCDQEACAWRLLCLHPEVEAQENHPKNPEVL